MADVTFVRTNTTGKGNFVHQKHGMAPIVFKGGAFKTSDRQVINELLSSEEMQRGEIKCATPMEIVNDWLLGNEPDKLTRKTLSKVSKEGLTYIANEAGVHPSQHQNYPAVIITMVEGKPVTNKIKELIAEYSTEEEATDYLGLLEDHGVVYRSGAWYKFVRGTERNKSDDLSLGKNEGKARKWIAENMELVEKKLKADPIETTEE